MKPETTKPQPEVKKQEMTIGVNTVKNDEGQITLIKDGITSSCPFSPLIPIANKITTINHQQRNEMQFTRISCSSACPHFNLKAYTVPPDALKEKKENDVFPSQMLTLTCGRGVVLPIFEEK